MSEFAVEWDFEEEGEEGEDDCTGRVSKYVDLAKHDQGWMLT